MLAHFGHPAVLFSHVLAVATSFFLFRLPYGVAMTLTIAISAGLAVVDYLVHTSVHSWKWLRFPTATAVWIVAFVLVLITGLVMYGWQLAVLFLVQGLWDNSWHARHHHRKEREPRAELDHSLIRWGAAVVAVVVILAPSLLLGS